MSVLDLYSGAGGVGKAAVRLGANARFFELSHGPEGDLTSKPVLEGIKKCIDRNEVLGAVMGPPCSSWGTAADRGPAGAIRAVLQPWGLPPELLSERQQARLALGNNIFRHALRLLRWLAVANLPCVLEHPINSRIWHTTELQTLIAKHKGIIQILDQCQVGTRWRKRTKLLFINVNWDDTVKFSRRCTGRNGICSRTGRPHLILEGNAKGGKRWTTIAAAYPAKLNTMLAQTVLSEARAQLAAA